MEGPTICGLNPETPRKLQKDGVADAEDPEVEAVLEPACGETNALKSPIPLTNTLEL
jgi:hypothetical protein